MQPISSTIKKPRIQYIDALRGFTMLLVVFAHIETFSFESGGMTTFLGRTFQLFRMPLFFFISGFIAYKLDGDWSLSQCWNLVKKKLRVQLISTLIIGTLFVYVCTDGTFLDFLCSSSKYGYWFTIVLLEMFLIYYLVRVLCIRNKILNNYHLVILLLLSILLLLLYRILPLDSTVANIFSTNAIFKYFHYFVIGMFASRYVGKFFDILDNGVWMASVLSVFIICLYVINYFNFPGQFIVICGAGYCGLVIVFAFFRRYQVIFDSEKHIGRVFQFIGKRTLDIYLLHYFLIPKGLKSLDGLLVEISNPLLEFTIVILLSILVVVGCLLISSVIRISSVASRYLLGTN